MTGEPRFPEYRAGPMKPAGPSLGMIAIMAGLAYMAGSGAPLAALLGVAALVVVFVGLLYLASRRVATFTGPDHITVKRVFGLKEIAWRDVQAIDVEANAVATVETTAPGEFVVVYDRTGRKTVLPHLNGRNVPSLPDEVRALRDLWERRRGADWAPAPEAAAAMTRSRRRTDTANSWFRTWMICLAAAMGSLMVTAVLLVVLVLTGATEDAEGPLAVLLSPVMILVVPVIVLLGMLATAALRRGRRR
jgi:hypothetical protein